MGNWRETILREFIPGYARLTLVADPDRLLLEEGIAAEIRRRGFYLLVYEDPVAFRYAYESQHRIRWDNGEKTELVVVAPFPRSQWDRFPHDVLARGRKLSFSLAELFPKLSYTVLRKLSPQDVDRLSQVYHEFAGPPTDAATCDFLLRRVFRVPHDTFEEVEDLLAYLLYRHTEGLVFPEVLDRYLIDRLKRRKAFRRLPLEQIIPSRHAFFAYLQEEWSRFVGHYLRKSGKVRDPGLDDVWEDVLPFDASVIRSWVDNLFVEGMLRPVAGVNPYQVPLWMRAGIEQSEGTDGVFRFHRLLAAVENLWNEKKDGAGFWQHLAAKMAELFECESGLSEPPPEETASRWERLKQEIEEGFERWMLERFASVISLPYLPRPVMLHHVPHWLANERREKKTALVVVDGMSWVQWVQMRRFLTEKRRNWSFDEHTVFAWVPTVTNLSRQALFAGEPPWYFDDSWRTTDKEPVLWQRFWENQGVSRAAVGYRKGLGEGDVEDLSDLLENPSMKVIGLVIQSIDKMAHGVTQGSAGLRAEVGVWLNRGYLLTLIDRLLYNGFDVVLTSDHGHVECTGGGRINQGILAETRGHRARIYTDRVFRDEALKQHPDALLWPGVGLPSGVYVLLARGRRAFTNERGRILAHGGISIEEVLVPLVKVVEKR